MLDTPADLASNPLTLEEVMPYLTPEGQLHLELAGTRALLARQIAATDELQKALITIGNLADAPTETAETAETAETPEGDPQLFPTNGSQPEPIAAE